MALVVLAVLAVVVIVVRRVRRGEDPATAKIDKAGEHTTIDPETGAVTSVQAADLTMPADQLRAIWTPMHLERLARTYWRFLSRCTLGLVRVKYTEEERFVCLIGRPFVLLSFQAPEYEMNANRGIVRWRIERGVLVSRRGRGGNGYLEIDARRRPSPREGYERLHVEVAIANYYPEIASKLGRWIYANTQSRAHVLVTHGFLRSLSRLDLAESRVGRYATLDEVPDPPAPEREPVAK
jgi:hypothetical protein